MNVFLVTLITLATLVTRLPAVEKGDLIFRNSPDSEELFNPHHVAISIDGKNGVIGAENEYFKTKDKKEILKKVEITDLRDYSWENFRVERSTSILNSSPGFKALPLSEQKIIRDAIVDFAVKQLGKSFDHPLEDGPDADPGTWYCSELTKEAYSRALENFPDIKKEIHLPLTPWGQFEWQPPQNSAPPPKPKQPLKKHSKISPFIRQQK